jgi:heme exporter protein B
MLKSLWLLFYIELILRLRRLQESLYPLGFFLIVITLFPLAFTPDPQFLQQFIPGGIWIAALLASLLSIETIFVADREDGHLEQILLSQLPLTFVLLTKLTAQWVTTQLPLILLVPLLGLLFHLPGMTVFLLSCSLLLGTPILTLIGSMSVALTLGLRQQGVLLGLIMLPLVMPVLIVGVSIVQQAQAGFSVLGPLSFLAGLSVFAITLLPWAIACTLRVGEE